METLTFLNPYCISVGVCRFLSVRILLHEVHESKLEECEVKTCEQTILTVLCH